MTQNEALVQLEALLSAKPRTLENLTPCPIASRVFLEAGFVKMTYYFAQWKDQDELNTESLPNTNPSSLHYDRGCVC